MLSKYQLLHVQQSGLTDAPCLHALVTQVSESVIDHLASGQTLRTALYITLPPAPVKQRNPEILDRVKCQTVEHVGQHHMNIGSAKQIKFSTPKLPMATSTTSENYQDFDGVHDYNLLYVAVLDILILMQIIPSGCCYWARVWEQRYAQGLQGYASHGSRWSRWWAAWNTENHHHSKSAAPHEMNQW